MRWWLVAALAAAVAAPAAPTRTASTARSATARGARQVRRRPVNYSLSVATELGMVDQLRRQLIADNEDYLSSESEGIPMRARLSGESGGEPEREPGAGRSRETTPQETRFKEIAAREARLAMYLTSPVFRASPNQTEPIPDKEEPDRDPHESAVSQEVVPEHDDKPQPEDDKFDDETSTHAPDDNEETKNEDANHEEINDHSEEALTDQPPSAIPTRNFVSVEKFDEDYEFKTNRHFPHGPDGDFDEAQNQSRSGELKADDALDAHVMEIENRVEEEAHAQVMYDADPSHVEFRAHDDADATTTTASSARTERAITTVITPAEPRITPAEPGVTPAEPGVTPAEPGLTPAELGFTPAEPGISSPDKPDGKDIRISKRDLLYYMDEEKFAKSNLSIGFNADVAIDYKDFAHAQTKTQQEAANDTNPASKKYRVLKMRGGGGRRSGRGGRRFIQEEGAGGVAIINVDAGPFPEFRLPRERRQYMHSADQSDSDADDAASSTHNALEPQKSLPHAPS